MGFKFLCCQRPRAVAPHSPPGTSVSAPVELSKGASGALGSFASKLDFPEQKPGRSEEAAHAAREGSLENARTNGVAPISTAESDASPPSAAPAAPAPGGGDKKDDSTGSPSPRLIPPEGEADVARPAADLAEVKGEEGLGIRTAGSRGAEGSGGDAPAPAVPEAEGPGAAVPERQAEASSGGEGAAAPQEAAAAAEASAAVGEGKPSEAAGEKSVERPPHAQSLEPFSPAAVGAGGEERKRSSVRDSLVSFEDLLERKWKKLEAYLEEEQLFKAFSYVLFLEHQIDRRLAVLNATLGLPPASASCFAPLFPGRERAEERAQFDGVDGGAEEFAAASRAAPPASTMLLKKQEDLRTQREFLLAFATRVVTNQAVKNLCFEMRWALQMLSHFHLDHLRQACEEPRLSVCESLSSLPRSASCASQSSTLSYFNKLSATDAAKDRADRAAEALGGATRGGGLGGAAGDRDGGRDDDAMTAGNSSTAFPERKISATKIKQGLRNMSRKMSFSRRGSSARRSSVRKMMTKKVQDDEGWIREKGKYLDLAYRVEKDTSVSMKVRGKLPCRLFEVLSILNETDLAGTWAPFFKSAEREYQYTKASQLVRQVYDYPILGAKETLMFCVGINALEEAGCVIIFCRSPPEGATEFLGLPIPEKRKILRIQSADLVFLLYPISEGRQTTLELYANFHHGLRFVPMKIITFVVKKVVRGMFVAIARQCQNFQTGPYKARVKNNPAFYNWMETKIEEYVQQQTQGHVRNAESISLASFNYEDFQE